MSDQTFDYTPTHPSGSHVRVPDRDGPVRVITCASRMVRWKDDTSGETGWAHFDDCVKVGDES